MRIISLNIEKDRHLDLVIPFLKTQKDQGFSVFCLQEVFAKDVELITRELNLSALFFPMCQYQAQGYDHPQGTTLFYDASKVILRSGEMFCYFRDSDDLPHYTVAQPHIHAGLIIARLQLDDYDFTVATTHFPVAPDGGTSTRQHQAYDSMMDYLNRYTSDLILCGDFNAPRGKEIFTRLKQQFRGHIPTEVTSTIDGDLHRAGHLELVVDGFFSTPHYNLNKIEIVSGVSDHKAIVADIERV